MFVKMFVRASGSQGNFIKVHKFNIEPFNEQNFKVWQIAYKVILISQDQIDALDNDWLFDKGKKPLSSYAKKWDPPTYAQSSAKALTPEEIARRNKDQKNYSTIHLCLTRNVTYNFVDETTVRGI